MSQDELDDRTASYAISAIYDVRVTEHLEAFDELR